MTPAQLANIQIVADSMDFGGLPKLDDDAVAYAGSATWSMWQNHVPEILRAHWTWLSEEARICVYLATKSVTIYELDAEKAELSRLRAFLDKCEAFLDCEGMASTSEEVAEVIERFVKEALA